MSFLTRLLGAAWGRAPKASSRPAAGALDERPGSSAPTLCVTAPSGASTGAERALLQNQRALTYLRSGDRAAAVAAFVDALDADARCVAVIVNVGNLLLEDGNLDEAVTHYQAALHIDDTSALAHLNLGVAYKQLGRRFDAVREFRRAHRLEARLCVRRL